MIMFRMKAKNIDILRLKQSIFKGNNIKLYANTERIFKISFVFRVKIKSSMTTERIHVRHKGLCYVIRTSYNLVYDVIMVPSGVLLCSGPNVSSFHWIAAL